MNKELSAVKKKIAKLLALGNGTQNSNESMIALSTAGRLMKEFALSIDDIEFGDEKIKKDVIYASTRQRPVVYPCLVHLAEFLSVKIWISRPHKWQKTAKFETHILGYESDLELFRFFYGMIEGAFTREYAKYKSSKEYARDNLRHHGRTLLSSFKYGFTQGISTKLRNLIHDNSEVKTKSGTALVPLKMGNVENFFETEFNISLTRSARTKYSANNSNAYYNGTKASEKFNFNRPVNGGSKPRMITG